MSLKCDTELGTHVPEDMKLEWAQRAAKAGCSSSELLRDLVCFHLKGVTFTEYVTKYRRAALGLPEAQQTTFSATSGPNE